MQQIKTFKYIINNVEKEFEILYTFKSLNTKKDYIIYTDNTYDNNKLNIFASIYYPMDMKMELKNIENDEDWKEIENFLNNLGDKYE